VLLLVLLLLLLLLLLPAGPPPGGGPVLLLYCPGLPMPLKPVKLVSFSRESLLESLKTAS
jgi:hypothetical protein